MENLYFVNVIANVLIPYNSASVFVSVDTF